jgi:hypothetical protein
MNPLRAGTGAAPTFVSTFDEYDLRRLCILATYQSRFIVQKSPRIKHKGLLGWRGHISGLRRPRELITCSACLSGQV